MTLEISTHGCFMLSLIFVCQIEVLFHCGFSFSFSLIKEGRDKIAKMLQYGSRFIMYHMLLNDPKNDIGLRAKGMFGMLTLLVITTIQRRVTEWSIQGQCRIFKI